MCRSYPYKRLIIYQNESPDFGTNYYSVVNPKKSDENGKKLHAHANTKKAAEMIADCFNELLHRGFCSRKYNLITRCKAMRLGGDYIKLMY